MQVLHLEDSDADAELVAHRLTSTWPGCKIRRATTRGQFQLEIDAGSLDLILSDYTLPSFNGLTALEIARAQCPETPFIFLSGTIGEERAIEALRRGAADYVMKDRSGRLLPAINQAFARVEEVQLRARAEEALYENREHFRQIVEHVTDLIVILDLAGNWVYRNPAYFATVGGPESNTSRDVSSSIFPEDRPCFEEAFQETLHTQQGQRAEYRLLRADHTPRWVEAQTSVILDTRGTVVRVLVVARDISERRSAEDQIRQQAALLDHAQDAIIVRDAENHITYWNRGAAHLYGWSADEAKGRSATELLGEERAQSELAVSNTISSHVHIAEMRHQTKTGVNLVVQSRWALVQTSDGAPIEFLVINTDVTEKKRLEAHVLGVQRVESICLLAGGVAHDINNLLVPILCSAELLTPSVTDAEGKHFVSMIHSSAQYAAALVQQLLAFSRGQEGQKAELSIRVMLREVVGFLSQTLPSTVKISLSLSEMPWLVYGDATQLKQVLVNLCMNARDAMPNGGAITITSSNTVLSAADAKILREIGPGKYVMIEVTDTGTGIPEEHFHKIFDPFFTTKDVGKGIGLGLAAVRGIVKGHHGSIIAESNYGFGATFRLYLPTSDLPTGPSRNGSETDTVRNGDGECILLVDDDASLREIMGTMLTSSGYRVLKAVSGNDALAIMKRHRDEIALVLTDITMSDMDGFTLIESLHSQKTYPPILAISGMTGCEHFDERAIELNVTLLAKPVSRETLLTSISAALAKGGGVSVAD